LYKDFFFLNAHRITVYLPILKGARSSYTHVLHTIDDKVNAGKWAGWCYETFTRTEAYTM